MYCNTYVILYNDMFAKSVSQMPNILQIAQKDSPACVWYTHTHTHTHAHARAYQETATLQSCAPPVSMHVGSAPHINHFADVGQRFLPLLYSVKERLDKAGCGHALQVHCVVL